MIGTTMVSSSANKLWTEAIKVTVVQWEKVLPILVKVQ